jgi:Leucine-rich repeat (LRR) protein
MFNVEAYLNSLPADVKIIDLSDKQLTFIPSLEKFWNLRIFYCCNNQLTSLPKLPAILKNLYCRHNRLTSFPQLPATLKLLYCSHNQFSCLPLLPATLVSLDCSINYLVNLPPLPATLQFFSCNNNHLVNLPPLPATLKVLVCCYNQLTSLPQLPTITLDCSSNQLTSLPPLPATLKYFFCTNNQLVNLPPLPPFLTSLWFKYNPIYDILEANTSISTVRLQINVINQFCFTFYSQKCKQRLRAFLWLKVREPKIKAQFHPRYLLKGLKEETDIDEFVNEWVKTNEY